MKKKKNEIQYLSSNLYSQPYLLETNEMQQVFCPSKFLNPLYGRIGNSAKNF